jgi:putative hydrolase
LHGNCIKPLDIESHTRTLIKAMENPYVDVIGHPDNIKFQVNIEEFVLAAKKFSKLIEINNHSFVARKGSELNCIEILQMCKKHQVRIVCASDAHISYDVGNFSNIVNLIKESKIDEELIVNTSINKMLSYLKEKKKRLKDIV